MVDWLPPNRIPVSQRVDVEGLPLPPTRRTAPFDCPFGEAQDRLARAQDKFPLCRSAAIQTMVPQVDCRVAGANAPACPERLACQPVEGLLVGGDSYLRRHALMRFILTVLLVLVPNITAVASLLRRHYYLFRYTIGQVEPSNLEESSRHQ